VISRRGHAFFLLPVLSFLFVVTLLPVLYLLIASLTPLMLTAPSTARDFTEPLRNYRLLLADQRLLDSAWTQARLSVFSVSLQLLLGLGVALLLHHRSSSTSFLRAVFLVPMVLPPIAVAVIWKVLYSPDISPAWWVFDNLGWRVPAPITTARWALPAIIAADTWEWFPFTMLIVLAALKSMPEDWFEAAKIDGAEVWQVTWFIILPQLRGVLLVAGLFRLIDSIKTFPLIYLLTEGGPGTATEVTNYYVFVQAFNFSYLGYSSAVSVVLVLCVVALSWFILRAVEGGHAHV